MKSTKTATSRVSILFSLHKKYFSVYAQMDSYGTIKVLTSLAVAFCLTLIFVLSSPTHGFARHKIMTAHSILAQVPPTIFDNTFLPISESEKTRILDANAGKNWIIIHDSPDFLYLMPKESEFAQVEVRVFRGTEGGVAVLGARTSDGCATEMWQFTKNGGIIPYFIESEPMPADYLPKGIALAQNISASFPLCFEGDKLEAKAMFWDTDGIITIPTTNRVFFNWDGTTFNKEIAENVAPPRRPDLPESYTNATDIICMPLNTNIYIHNATIPLREAILLEGTLTAPNKILPRQGAELPQTNMTIKE